VPAPAPPAVADLGDLSASMVSARPPSYPLASRRAREQGTVVISVRLGPDGRVGEASIARSSGYDRRDQAALEAVRRWRWSPTVRAGAQVEVVGLVRIPFVLRT
jgi:protein TonB